MRRSNLPSNQILTKAKMTGIDVRVVPFRGGVVEAHRMRCGAGDVPKARGDDLF